MRKSQEGLMSHPTRMEAPPSEKDKLLLVHEKPEGESDYIAYRPNSVLKRKSGSLEREITSTKD